MFFDIQSVAQQLNIDIGGVIHVGAFDGAELTHYRKLNLFNTILFEPQREMYNVVSHKCIDDEVVYNVALGSKVFNSSLISSSNTNKSVLFNSNNIPLKFTPRPGLNGLS